MSRDFAVMLAKNGIQHRYTTPNTPAGNGLAERAGRSLLEAARCMLIHSSASE